MKQWVKNSFSSSSFFSGEFDSLHETVSYVITSPRRFTYLLLWWLNARCLPRKSWTPITISHTIYPAIQNKYPRLIFALYLLHTTNSEYLKKERLTLRQVKHADLQDSTHKKKTFDKLYKSPKKTYYSCPLAVPVSWTSSKLCFA